jgi:hypothetical protein
MAKKIAMSQILELALVAILIAALTFILTSEQLRQALSDHNAFLLAAITAIAAAVGFVAKETFSTASSVFREWIAPLDRISVFIEDVKFEFPTIPDNLLHRSAGINEISRLVGNKFSSLTETLRVTEEEAERINHLSRNYRFLNEIVAEEPYELSRIFSEFISTPLYLSNRFMKLPETMNGWVEFLSRHRASNRKDAVERLILQEVERTWLQFNNLIKYFIDLIVNDEIKIDLTKGYPSDVCLEDLFSPQKAKEENSPAPGLQLKHLYVVVRDHFYWLGPITVHDQKYMDGFVDLFRSANIDGLIELFELAGLTFERVG